MPKHSPEEVAKIFMQKAEDGTLRIGDFNYSANEELVEHIKEEFEGNFEEYLKFRDQKIIG